MAYETDTETVTLTRAERIRRRRAQQRQGIGATAPRPAAAPRSRAASPRPASRAAEPAVAPPTQRVVVSRHGLVGGSVSPQQATRPMMRVPLRGEAEVVATLPRIRSGWAAFSGVLALLALAVVAALWGLPTFRVREVVIEGTERVSPEALRWLLPVGKPTASVHPELLAGALRHAYPILADVQVRVGLTGRLVVRVRERQPILVWEEGTQRFWVDAEGVLFPPVEGEGPTVVVRAQGAPPTWQGATRSGQRLAPEVVDALRVLAAVLPEGTPLLYHPQQGVGWLAPEGWQVYLGPEPTHLEVRLTVYQALIETLKREGIRPSVVDLSSLNAPYVQTEP